VFGPVYDWFTEGFGTLEMKDVRALLDEQMIKPSRESGSG
jgi:hypothetical protein